MPRRTQFVLLFAVALAASASTWFYVARILKPAQVADAAAHGKPRGNLSDLYPRWLGSRELLLHGRNPYSREITIEIQKGYYGRPLDPSRPDDPKDQQGFAYPAYVAFLLAPTVSLPFDTVQAGFRWLLIVLVCASVPLWLRLLQWKLSAAQTALCLVLVLGAISVVQGIKLQQLTLLVAVLLAGCGACLVRGHFYTAGVLLALATIKPQLVWPLVLWLFVWVLTGWRSRWRFAAAFLLVMALLLGGAEILLPGWWRYFLQAIPEYRKYTNSQSVMEFLFGYTAGRFFELLAVLGCGLCLWRMRAEDAASIQFGSAFVLVLALTILIVPMYAPYNQILLLPAILMLVRDARTMRASSRAFSLAGGLGALLLIWPWLATIGLSIASFWLTTERKQSVWTLPFYTNFGIPVFVFGLALVDVWMRQRTPGSEQL